MRTSSAHRPLTVHVCGMWHLGLVTAACLSEVGHRVIGTDLDDRRISEILAGRLPVYEPGLDDLVVEGIQAGTLEFSADIAGAGRRAHVTWIALDVPIGADDRADLSTVIQTAEILTPALGSHDLVVVSSQVPVGTCHALQARLGAGDPASGPVVAYVPENLRLGAAIDRFRQPDMVVVGVEDDVARSRLEDLFASFEAPTVFTTLRTAEMVKHAINAFLGTSISLANELGDLCEVLGVDGQTVAEAMRLDRRIGPHARVTPGLGFSGGTLARDLVYLRDHGQDAGLGTPLIDAVLAVNDGRARRLIETLGRQVKLGESRIGILGLTYTANTSTLRRSAPADIARRIAERALSVKAFDPHVDASSNGWPDGVREAADPYAAAEGVDAILLLSGGSYVPDLDFGRLAAAMRGRILFDGRPGERLDEARLSGLRYLRLGVGTGRTGQG